jgi:hypothetical protein
LFGFEQLLHGHAFVDMVLGVQRAGVSILLVFQVS